MMSMLLYVIARDYSSKKDELIPGVWIEVNANHVIRIAVLRTPQPYINALTIFTLEMRETMVKMLPEVLLDLSKISDTKAIASPMLEFLSSQYSPFKQHYFLIHYLYRSNSIVVQHPQ